MTEKEAKMKWCPMARIKALDTSWNRWIGSESTTRNPRCYASDCMMWVWSRTGSASMTGWVEWDKDAWEGYCGLTK